MSSRVLRLKNFQTSARITVQSSFIPKPLFGSRSLALTSTNQQQLKLYNREPVQESQASSIESESPPNPKIFSDGEVETAGPVLRL